MLKFLLGLIVGIFIILKIKRYDINIKWNWEDKENKDE